MAVKPVKAVKKVSSKFSGYDVAFGITSWSTPAGDVERLNKEEEEGLSRIVLGSSPEESLKAQNELVKRNWSLPFYMLQRKYSWIPEGERESSVSDAFQGLACAARKFNSDRARFSAFACLKICQSVNDGLNTRRRWFSGVPMEKTSRLHGELSRNPEGTVEELAVAVGSSPQTTALMLQAIVANQMISTDSVDYIEGYSQGQGGHHGVANKEDIPVYWACERDLASIVKEAAKIEGIDDEELELIAGKGEVNKGKWSHFAKRKGITVRSAQTLSGLSQWKIRRRVFLMLGETEYRSLFGTPPGATWKNDTWRQPLKRRKSS